MEYVPVVHAKGATKEVTFGHCNLVDVLLVFLGGALRLVDGVCQGDDGACSLPVAMPNQQSQMFINNDEISQMGPPMATKNQLLIIQPNAEAAANNAAPMAAHRRVAGFSFRESAIAITITANASAIKPFALPLEKPHQASNIA